MKMVLADNRDITFIATVCREAKQLYDPFMPGSFERQAIKYEENGLPSSYQIKLLYNDEGARIGFEAQSNISKDINYIVGLYILKKYQRKGYGTKVLENLLSDGREKGIKEYVLLVHKKAKWAIDFYLKSGFAIVARSEDEVNLYLDDMKDFYVKNTYMMSYVLV